MIFIDVEYTDSVVFKSGIHGDTFNVYREELPALIDMLIKEYGSQRIAELESELATLRPLGKAVEKFSNLAVSWHEYDSRIGWTVGGVTTQEKSVQGKGLTLSAALIALAKEVGTQEREP